jgi:hypothetical protein
MRCVTVIPLTVDAAPTLEGLISELTPLIKAVPGERYPVKRWYMNAPTLQLLWAPPGFITFEMHLAADGTAVVIDEYTTADAMIASNALTVSERLAVSLYALSVRPSKSITKSTQHGEMWTCAMALCLQGPFLAKYSAIIVGAPKWFMTGTAEEIAKVKADPSFVELGDAVTYAVSTFRISPN